MKNRKVQFLLRHFLQNSSTQLQCSLSTPAHALDATASRNLHKPKMGIAGTLAFPLPLMLPKAALFWVPSDTLHSNCSSGSWVCFDTRPLSVGVNQTCCLILHLRSKANRPDFTPRQQHTLAHRGLCHPLPPLAFAPVSLPIPLLYPVCLLQRLHPEGSGIIHINA